jgi:uncharacterized protein (TIGR00297 family)
MTRSADHGRSLALVALGIGALLLRFIRWWEVIALLSAAVALAAFAVPRLRASERVTDALAEFHTPRIAYPLALLILVVVLPDRLDIVAGAWGILAASNGMAPAQASAGRRVPWNRDSSVSAAIGAMVCGGAAGAFLCWWCRPAIVPPPYPWFSIGAPIAAAIVAAGAATVPIRLQRNFTVAAVAASVLWALSLVSEDLARAAATTARAALPLATAVNVAAAAVGWLSGAVSRSGAIAGAAVGTLVAVSVGWPGWQFLTVMFGLVVLASRAGLRRKTRLGIAEANRGRRGAASAVANTVVATVAAALAVLTYATGPALIAFVAALVAGGADSMASEIGKAWGWRTFLVPSFREVPPGTPGAISLAGTAAGIASAFLLTGFAVWLGLVPAGTLLPIVVGTAVGSLVESALGATLEPPGILNSHVLNVLNTAAAALVAVKLTA